MEKDLELTVLEKETPYFRKESTIFIVSLYRQSSDVIAQMYNDNNSIAKISRTFNSRDSTIRRVLQILYYEGKIPFKVPCLTLYSRVSGIVKREKLRLRKLIKYGFDVTDVLEDLMGEAYWIIEEFYKIKRSMK